MKRTQKLMASVTAASALLLAGGCSSSRNCDPRTDLNCTSGGGGGGYYGGHYYGGSGGGMSDGSGRAGGFGGAHGGDSGGS